MSHLNLSSTAEDPDYVGNLCRRIGAALDEGMLPVEVFNDDQLFKHETQALFTKAWVFLGHESEIANTHDFMLRKVGLDQVIVSRSKDGQINVLLNHCRHRGTELCYEDRGNTPQFRCPYHGWVYKNNGDFVGAPDMRAAYGGKLDPKAWGLLRAPQVDTIHGLIFCSLDETAPSLQEYLGDAVPMLNAIFGLHPDGMKVLGPPERSLVKTDWKIGAENFGGDAYHVGTAHYSASLSQFVQGDLRETGPNAVVYCMDNGHSFVGHRLAQWFGPPFQFWGYPQAMVEQFDLAQFSEAELEMIRDRPPTIGTIFPNFSYLRFPSTGTIGGFPVPFTTLRMWQPVGPGTMELWTWQIGYKCAPDAFNEECYVAGQLNFGSAGMLEQDDTAVWEGIGKVGRSPWARNAEMTLHYNQMTTAADPDWAGPGTYHPTAYGENAQRAFWRRWLEYVDPHHDRAPVEVQDER